MNRLKHWLAWWTWYLEGPDYRIGDRMHAHAEWVRREPKCPE